MAFSLLGSSPHTRGAPPEAAGEDGERGIIPAYAGSTQNICDGRHEEVDHPRIRGEHPLSFMGGGAYWGSSPHTRGARPPDRHRRPGERIIPAYAGSTRSLTPPSPAAADHPRIRGEHSTVPIALIATAGSSPHTRGALAPSRLGPAPGRIIPAYAGSTPGIPKAVCSSADHPRIRGEHHLYAGGGLSRDGSSPHTRGAQGVLALRQAFRRIIPAYAGSTDGDPVTAVVWSDHPRIRGEHEIGAVGSIFPSGSSPHTRGARRSPRSGVRGPRIIPAYAGSTRPRRRLRRWRRDHPRIRGEHSMRNGVP